ncbi:hypothetical protein PT286_01880 [Neisseriaceae bacterium ESL0693]|nr:hypothetical protein [Neisseriaceae bacterium ESL0693]
MAKNDKPKQHRKDNQVIRLYGLSPSGSRYLPLSELGGMEPMDHCSANKGEFITVSEDNDMCVINRGAVFAGDDPDSILSGFDYYYAMTDYVEGEIQLTSETEAMLPTPRSRTNIGVGEVVRIYADKAVTWQLNNKLASIVRQDSKELWIAASDQGGTCTVNAFYTEKDKTFRSSIKFMIVEPKGLQFSMGKYQDYPELERPDDSNPLIYHPKNGYNGAVGLSMKLLPKSVNFSKVQIREINCASRDTGYFAMNQIHCHIQGHPITNGQCTGAGEKLKFQDIGNNTNISIGYDTVGGGDNDPNVDIGQGGSMIVDIPIEWSLVKPEGTPEKWKSLGTVHQEVILQSNGDIQVSKGNFRYTLKKGEHYPDNHFMPKQKPQK